MPAPSIWEQYRPRARSVREESTIAPAPPPEPAWHQWSVGDRVVVRYRIPRARSADPGHTDVLGELLACGPEGVTVRTRSGDVVVVPADLIALGKRVPPPPPRRRRGDQDA